MARTDIPVVDSDHGGVDLTTEVSSDATNDHSFDNPDGRTLLLIRNTNAGSVTVTVLTSKTYGDPPIALEDEAIVVPTGKTYTAGPFSTGIFNQTDGKVYVDVTVATDIKFRAVRAPLAVA